MCKVLISCKKSIKILKMFIHCTTKYKKQIFVIKKVINEKEKG